MLPCTSSSCFAPGLNKNGQITLSCFPMIVAGKAASICAAPSSVDCAFQRRSLVNKADSGVNMYSKWGTWRTWQQVVGWGWGRCVCVAVCHLQLCACPHSEFFSVLLPSPWSISQFKWLLNSQQCGWRTCQLEDTPSHFYSPHRRGECQGPSALMTHPIARCLVGQLSVAT